MNGSANGWLWARAWSWVVRIEWARRRRSLADLVNRLEAARVAATRTVPADAALAAVRRAYRLSPFTPSCLKESLAALGLLRRVGHPARLVIGVKGPDVPVEAHAWLEVDGAPIEPASALYMPLRRPEQRSGSR